MLCYSFFPSPLGTLVLLSDGVSLTGLTFGGHAPAGDFTPELPVFLQTEDWLNRYFAGEAPSIAGLPLNPAGTPFQKQVWEILCRIPQGQLRSYGSIAREIAAARGQGKMSAQAVGQAVGRNPICIIIPCHRVVGSQGALTGYAGGLENKRRLLLHEGHTLKEDAP